MSQKITIQEVQKTAELARIKLTEKEAVKFASDLDSVLDFFADIQEAQSDAVEKFDHYQLKENQLRKDEVSKKKEEFLEDIKKNFPDSQKNYLKVKTVNKK